MDKRVKLNFSVAKTQAMVIKGQGIITNRRYPTLKIHGQTIRFQEQIKYLGVLIQKDDIPPSCKLTSSKGNL